MPRHKNTDDPLYRRRPDKDEVKKRLIRLMATENESLEGRMTDCFADLSLDQTLFRLIEAAGLSAQQISEKMGEKSTHLAVRFNPKSKHLFSAHDIHRITYYIRPPFHAALDAGLLNENFTVSHEAIRRKLRDHLLTAAEIKPQLWNRYPETFADTLTTLLDEATKRKGPVNTLALGRDLFTASPNELSIQTITRKELYGLKNLVIRAFRNQNRAAETI